MESEADPGFNLFTDAAGTAPDAPFGAPCIMNSSLGGIDLKPALAALATITSELRSAK
jgi:hypothetical protein